MKNKNKIIIIAIFLVVFSGAMINVDILMAIFFMNHIHVMNDYVECVGEITEVSEPTVKTYYNKNPSEDESRYRYSVKQSFSYSYEYEGKVYDNSAKETLYYTATDDELSQSELLDRAKGKGYEKGEKIYLLIDPNNPNEIVFKDEFENDNALVGFVFIDIFNVLWFFFVFEIARNMYYDLVLKKECKPLIDLSLLKDDKKKKTTSRKKKSKKRR